MHISVHYIKSFPVAKVIVKETLNSNFLNTNWLQFVPNWK